MDWIGSWRRMTSWWNNGFVPNEGVCFKFAPYKWQFNCLLLQLDLYSQKSLIEFSFDRSEEGPLEAFEDIFATFENKK